MEQWTLRAKLSALVLGAALLTGLVGALALWSNTRIAERMGLLQEHRLDALVRLDVLGRGLERQRAQVLSTLAATNELMVEALEKQVAQDAIEMPAALALLRSRAEGESERKAVDDLAAALKRSREEGLAGVLERLRKGQFIEADVASQSRYRPQMDAASRALDDLIALQVGLAGEQYREAMSLVKYQALVTIGAIAAALLGGFLLCGLAIRALGRLLGAGEHALARAARLFAEGRLDQRLALADHDRSSVAWSLNRVGESLSTLVAGVADGAERVSESSARMAEASRELSERASASAASLEETLAAMQQLGATVGQNSERAAFARERSGAAAASAAEGGEAVGAAMKTMREVSESSRRVGEIVGTIDAIAFQTNILALNAAVEAARAGEAGRGFAVVAAEVRALSQRSATAAREIRNLARESMERIDAGRHLVESAGGIMESMVQSARESTRIVGEIADACHEQASGILQANRALEQLEGVTQRNAALAGGAATQSEEMAALAHELLQSVSRFEHTAQSGAAVVAGQARHAPVHPPRIAAAPRAA